MAKIFQYQKIIDQYTTHALNEPDYEQLENKDRITELCTIDGITYVSVPEKLILPEQSAYITKTLKKASINIVLREKIKKISPHVRLIKKRTIKKIREKYDMNDEMKINRRKIAKEIKADADFSSYNIYVKSCILWGKDEITKLGL